MDCALRQLPGQPKGRWMKHWLDTEFIARPFTIDLISVGMGAEDGREFYAESSEVDWSKANAWTLANVRPQLDGKGTRPHDFVNRRDPPPLTVPGRSAGAGAGERDARPASAR